MTEPRWSSASTLSRGVISGGTGYPNVAGVSGSSDQRDPPMGRSTAVSASRSVVKELVMSNNFILVMVAILIVFLLFWCMDMSSSGYYLMAVIILLMIMYVHRSWMWIKNQHIVRRVA